MAAVLEDDGGVEHQSRALGHEIDDESEVLDDRQVVAEGGAAHRLGAEDERRPVEPVAVEQAGHQRLAAEDGRLRGPRADGALHAVAQRVGRVPVVVDHPDAGLDDRRVGEPLVRGAHRGDEVGKQQVVAAEEHHQVRLRRARGTGRSSR